MAGAEGVPLQPVAAADLADVLVAALERPGDRVPAVAGPTVETVGSLARTYRERRGLRRPILPVPVPGSTAAGFRAGHATRPDRAVGTITWAEWLAAASGDGDAGEDPPAAEALAPS
ncbi:hypothetical protein [Halobaculum litoreum]|uniref:Uncharacterized protein n=1 Tax=Halobaculum litoreum TaxID=3031998 RepID=A0ABD5XUR7_9EURY|nr:hypothetical protein [Halobaculum sp. DT92]